LGDAPLFLMVSYRSEDLPDNDALAALLHGLKRSHPYAQLHLGRLNRDQVQEFVTLQLGPKLEAGGRLGSLLFETTNGNPLFVAETLRDIEERWQESGTALRPMAEMESPELETLRQSILLRRNQRVQEIILERIERLPADAHTILNLCAVIGRDFSLDLLERAAAHDPLDALEAEVGGGGELGVGGLAAVEGVELAADPGDLVLGVDHVHGQSHGAAGVGEGAADRVTDPPAGVGGEAIAEREAAAVEAAGHGDHEAEVGADEAVLGGPQGLVGGPGGGHVGDEGEAALARELDLHADAGRLAGLEAAGAPATTAVMVGDRNFDVEGGRHFGLVTIGVSWGYAPDDELTDAGADHIVTTIDDLAGLLLGHTK
jgi:hypothetical protein